MKDKLIKVIGLCVFSLPIGIYLGNWKLCFIPLGAFIFAVIVSAIIIVLWSLFQKRKSRK